MAKPREPKAYKPHRIAHDLYGKGTTVQLPHYVQDPTVLKVLFDGHPAEPRYVSLALTKAIAGSHVPDDEWA